MSRIRSHLDSLVAPKPAHAPAHQPAYPQHGYDSGQRQPYGAPHANPPQSAYAAARHGNDDALARIQQRLDALGNAIERSGNRSLREPHATSPHSTAPVATRDLDRVRDSLDQLAGKIQAIASQTEKAKSEPGLDLETLQRSIADAVSRDLHSGFDAIRREMDDLRKEIMTPVDRAAHDDLPLQGEIERIATGIQQLQDSANISPDHLSQISAEVQYLRQGLDAIVANAPANLESAITSMDAKLEDRLNHVAGDLASLRNNMDSFTSPAADQSMLVGMADHISSLRSMVEQLPQSLNLADLHMRLEDVSSAVQSMSENGFPGMQNSGIEARLDEITRALVAVSVSPDGNGDSFERIEARLASLAKSVELLGENQLQGIAATDPRMDQLMLLPEELRAAVHALDEKLSSVPAGNQADLSPIEAQIDRLSQKIDNLGAMGTVSSEMLEDGRIELPSFAPLLNRIDELGERINQLGTTGSAAADMSETNHAIERLEAQIAGIAGQLESVQQQGFSAYGDASGEPAANQQVLEEIQHLSRRIDAMAGPGSAMPEAEQLSALERHLSEITAQLGSVGTLGVNLTPIEDRLGNIEDQVAASRDIAIEVATQAAERAVGMASSQAALSGSEGAGTAVSPDLLTALQADLRDLQDNTRNFNNTNLETFDAVRDTLSVIVTRLASIEEQMSRPQVATAYAQPAFTQPNAVEQQASGSGYQQHQPAMTTETGASIAHGSGDDMSMRHTAHEPGFADGNDEFAMGQSSFAGDPMQVEPPRLDMADLPHELEGAGHGGDNIADDGPIEPGSGAPDLSALVKQAGQRKRQSASTGEAPLDAGANSDIVAAARRAARAAQAEAEAQQKLEPVEPEKVKKGLFSGLGGLIGNNKKALMTGAAVLVIAALAVPMAGKFLGGNEPAVMSSNVTGNNGETSSQTTAADVGENNDTVASIDASENNDPIELEAAPSVVPEREVTPDNGQAADPVGNIEDEQLNDEAMSSGVAGQTANADQAVAGTSITSVPMPSAESGNPALRQAAAEGDAKALFEIARKYTDGDGVTRDMPTAAEWYTRSAERGLAPAQYRIGNIYEKGDGVERDVNKAVEWYQQAAEQGNVFAMHNLAALKADKRQLGDAADMGEAVRWFKQAAEFGVKDSQFNLGIIYGKGMGVEPDLVEAYKWFAVAAKSGDRRATENRDIIANQMRPDQLDKAKAEADLWKPQEINRSANTVEVPSEWKTKGTSASVLSPKDQVRFAQATLSKLGFDAGPADGLMGAKTRSAIKAFQQRAGLKVDGEISGELLQALQSVSS